MMWMGGCAGLLASDALLSPLPRIEPLSESSSISVGEGWSGRTPLALCPSGERSTGRDLNSGRAWGFFFLFDELNPRNQEKLLSLNRRNGFK